MPRNHGMACRGTMAWRAAEPWHGVPLNHGMACRGTMAWRAAEAWREPRAAMGAAGREAEAWPMEKRGGAPHNKGAPPTTRGRVVGGVPHKSCPRAAGREAGAWRACGAGVQRAIAASHGMACRHHGMACRHFTTPVLRWEGHRGGAAYRAALPGRSAWEGLRGGLGGRAPRPPCAAALCRAVRIC
jgi:hypothetical protein